MSALKKITIAVLLIIFSMVSYKIIRHHSRDIKIGEEAVYSDYKSFVFVTVIPEKITPQWQQAFDAIAREFDTKEHYQIHVIVPDNFEEKNTLNRESIKYITLGSLSTQSFYHSDLFLKLPQYAQLWSFGVAHMLDFPHSGLYSPESLVYLHQHAHNSREFFGYVTGFVESFGYYIYQVGPLPGHFALSPNMMFFHEDDYSKEWVLLIRQQLYERNIEYFQLISQKYDLLTNNANNSIDLYNKNLQERFSWLQTHPEISAYERGFYSQTLGEATWQRAVWDHRAAYILIEDLDVLVDHKYAPIVNAQEINTFFPQSHQKILEWMLIYSDLSEKNILDNHNLHNALKERLSQITTQIPTADREKFLQIYGQKDSELHLAFDF